MIRRIKYAWRLVFGKSQHLSLMIRNDKLEVMVKLDDNDTLLMMSPYLQGIIYQSFGIRDNWDIN